MNKLIALAMTTLLSQAALADNNAQKSYQCQNASAKADAKEPSQISIEFPMGSPTIIQLFLFDLKDGGQQMRGMTMARLDTAASTPTEIVYSHLDPSGISASTYKYVSAKVAMGTSLETMRVTLSDKDSPAHTTVFAKCQIVESDEQKIRGD
ncbi:MAG: hypothetical protein JST16_13465 [Bdellovibrionales bacterium]|nr:hypothetical protein [Bdellovibrionales bacterium]